MPEVSVIIAAYNRAHLVGLTIESVLAQTYQDFEVAVVDDGSTDNTREVVARYEVLAGGKLRYIYQPNGGLSAARNTGCRMARGRYLAFLDADDLWKPGKLAKQVPVLEANPHVGLVSAMAEVINADGTQVLGIKPARPAGATLREMVTEGTQPPSSFLVRRNASESIGHFDPAITRGVEDVDYCFRLARRWKFICLPDVLIQYRCHDTNLSSEPVGTYRGYVQTYRKLLADPSPEVPVGAARRLLAKYHYLLGCAYARQRAFRDALRELCASVRAYPFVGLLFVEGPHAWWRSGVGVVKPYLAVCGTGLAALVCGRKG